ncbi:MAG TPA: hypothetical protein VJ698_13665 [Noviherbaspirillum sp.]|nr:hypothetical protein [Noviherbaspirillum sp.]HJV86516.1 hypothetical protein [Noviherbaspirillum sp.]
MKRMFSLNNFTLQRRTGVLRVINIDFHNIALNVHDESLLIFEWGFEQEK